MRVTLVPYGALLPLLGAELEYEFSGVTSAELLAALGRSHPAFASWVPQVACALDDAVLRRDDPLPEGGRVALIPPVSGG